MSYFTRPSVSHLRFHFPLRPVKINPKASRRCGPASIAEIQKLESACSVPHHAARAASEFSRGFQPTGRSAPIPASRERRLNSIVADATGEKIPRHRGLKPTAKFKAPLTRLGAE